MIVGKGKERKADDVAYLYVTISPKGADPGM